MRACMHPGVPAPMWPCLTAARRTSPHEREQARMSASRRPSIVTVAAAKGGVGKTTLAYELAAGLGGVLVDLDWDAGGATRMWGFDPAKAARAPLLDGFERGPDGRPPRPKRRANQPELVPAHPDLSASRIDADLGAEPQDLFEVDGRRSILADDHDCK